MSYNAPPTTDCTTAHSSSLSSRSSLVCLLSYCATSSSIGLHYPLTFMPQRHNKFSMPHGEKGGGEREGGRDPARRLEQPGRYIGGIFQIYYPLICYIGERESSIISLLAVRTCSSSFSSFKEGLPSSPHLHIT